ncbi:hypothetical protein Taro_056468 [Colocasia esculenta]|uniref:Secreted protein n=1 Tax=Colocasia esculenta TaxID=4460 RepID=A0A843XTY9_COLES|nr:hypothetical protein [Colocasia esculenta]
MLFYVVGKRFLFTHLCWFARFLGEFPTEPVTCEAHPYSQQVKGRRRFRYRLPVQSRVATALGQHLQQCSFFFSSTSGYAPGSCTFI